MKIKIKDWEDMEREFGLDTLSDINCKFGFTEEMENQMPDNRSIDVTIDSRGTAWMTNLDWYAISSDMIKSDSPKI